MSNKIITNLLAAYDEQNIDEFKNLLKKNNKFFSDVDVNPDDKLIELLNKIVDDDGYEYLLEIEKIFESFELRVLEYKAKKILDIRYEVLLKHHEKGIKEMDYSVREDLEESIKALCYFVYHSKYAKANIIEGLNQPYFIMTNKDMEMALDNIFFQLNLMLDLIEGVQKYSTEFPGNPIENWVNYGPYKTIAAYKRVIELYPPKYKISYPALCRMVDVSYKSFWRFEKYNKEKFDYWKNSVTDDELEKRKQELFP